MASIRGRWLLLPPADGTGGPARSQLGVFPHERAVNVAARRADHADPLRAPRH